MFNPTLIFLYEKKENNTNPKKSLFQYSLSNYYLIPVECSTQRSQSPLQIKKIEKGEWNEPRW